ncbi:hypothetical protein X777_05250 [Ooceraea biroi]|uniref:Uncharacterized protein n=1 Tax=Ooceraea biroi TaxID=2015173 RepID=A0A026WGM5_OOCBI|nr:hypothetical protein X777_05250 [Ooceraea biroi]
MPRFAEEWRRSAPSSRRSLSFLPCLWKDFVRLLGGPEASSHHCLIYFVKQSCRQFNGPNYIKLGTA